MKRFFGGLLLGLGILIGGASGLCTLVFLSEGATAALAMGSIPIGIGIVLFFAGRTLLRSASRPEPPQESDQ